MKFDDFFNDNNSIPFYSYVELQSTEPIEMNIGEIFEINSSEISEFGNVLLSNDIPDGLKTILSKISWAIRAYIGFQDIFDFKSSIDWDEKRDDIEVYARQLCDFNKNYCFFESIAYLKEAIVCLLDGRFLATMVLLRPFLELSVANIYWTIKSERESSSQFYKWLLGNKKYKQSFSKMIDYYYENCDSLKMLDKNGLEENKKCIKEIYRRLCSYNHTPILEESMISHSGNTGGKSHAFFSELLSLFSEMLFCVNFIYLLNYPMALFPQDIYRHFGYFGGPMGLFFDEFNYAIIEKYFGKEVILLLTKALESYSIKDDLISFIEDKMLNDEEMEQSWQEFVTDYLNNRKYYDLKDHAGRVTLCKAHIRGFRISTNYMQNLDLEKIKHDFSI